jgi:putative peptidoglycan lipid II flippase
MAAILGAGPVADAFLVAFRLPNHFRAIFAEGAFASAFVPAYARRLEQDGNDRAREFANEIGTGLLLIQLVLLAAAWVFTPQMVRLLAPGLSEDPARFDLAVSFTRITFPYLALTAMLAMISGTLNANHRFASAAAAPVFLNISMVTALLTTLLATPFFPTAGHAAAWGVLIAGFLEVFLVAIDAEKHGFGFRFRMPKLDEPTKRFLKALGPAIIGAGGVQLALFADTIIATFLPAGALSALYYADRINQLPIGVAGIAIGIVLLPEMSRRLAANDEPGAAASQGRAIELSLLIAIPFAAGAIAIPELVMRALFMRGAFSAADAHAAAMTLAAYATGLIPFMLMRSFTAPFLARGDTATPVKAALTAVAVNILLKIVLTGPLSQVGLALATAAGAWLNLLLLIWAANRRGFERPTVTVNRVLILAAIGLVLGVAFYAGQRFASPYFTGLSRFGEETLLLVLLLFGTILYATLILMLLGKNWLRNLLRSGSPVAREQTAPGQRV